MTDALRGSGTIGPGMHVESVVLDPAAAGVGFMGEIGKIGVVYGGDATGAPTSMVAKFPTASPEIRAMMHPARIYEREHRFYTELATASPLRTPAVYHMTCDSGDTGGRAVHAAPRGPVLADRLVTRSPVSARAGPFGARRSGRTPRRVLERRRSGERRLRADHQRSTESGRRLGLRGVPAGVHGGLRRCDQAGARGLRRGVRGGASQILDDLAAMPHTLVHFDFRADNLCSITMGRSS